ncbi:YceI family protein [Flavobacterium praedii]|uniref:YceI family protein n=1 Tax=Flavobacterium praedii TaxID=3002900 RepID=UPI0024819CE9|nr:YceI family protein [Flavobacterium praedii]
MKRTALILLILMLGNTIFSQKMITRTGLVTFEASMPSFEEIAAKNNTASCILDKGTSDFVALVLIKGFQFKSPLMEEHFNENYMESSIYPKATFKGKVLNFDSKKLTTTKSVYDLEGDLTIHGVSTKIKTKINLNLASGKVVATSSFDVKPQDYKIEIPNLVKDKIAKNITINFNFSLVDQ